MLGALGLLVINANKLTKHFKENIGFQVYLKDTTSSAQIDGLIQEINGSKFAKSVSLITKEQAAAQLKENLGEDFITFLGSNPLLNALDVKINADYANTDTLPPRHTHVLCDDDSCDEDSHQGGPCVV